MIRIQWVPKRARIVHFKTRGEALPFDVDRFVEDVEPIDGSVHLPFKAVERAVNVVGHIN